MTCSSTRCSGRATRRNQMQGREIVKVFVDALVAERRQAAPASMQQVCERIGNSRRHMHAAWTANHDGLGYNDPWRRLAFVCAHMAPNADTDRMLSAGPLRVQQRKGEQAVSVNQVRSGGRRLDFGGPPK